MKFLVLVVVFIVLAIGAVSLAMLFGILPNPFRGLSVNPPEYSARYYPEDTLLYAWFTLYPEGGQRAQLQDIWDRFHQHKAFQDQIDELKDEFEKDTRIKLEEGILPWLGPEISAGLLDVDSNGDPVMAVTLDVRDEDAAAVFMDQWLDYVEDEEGEDFDAGTYLGFDVWVGERGDQAYALSESLLVFATAEDAMEDILDLVEDDAMPTLADSMNFQAARTALPQTRFSSAYVDIRQAIKLGEEFSGDELPEILALSDAGPVPEWLAASTGWVNQGLVMEFVVPNTSGYGDSIAALSDSGSFLPHNTLGFVAATFDPNVDNWRNELSKYLIADLMPDESIFSPNDLAAAGFDDILSELGANADLGNVLDFLILTVDTFTGIHLERDLFDHLGGEAIIAVEDFDFDEVERDPASNAISAWAMLSYKPDSEASLSKTMSKFADLLEEYGEIDSASVDVGADNPAQVFELDTFVPETGYSPGYMLHDDYLTVATTDVTLKTIVATEKGEGQNLASLAGYQRAVAHIPSDRQVLAWVNLSRIFAQLDHQDLEISEEQFRVIGEGVGPVAAGATANAEFIRATFVLTFFPEE